MIRLFIFQTWNMNQKVSSSPQEHFIYMKCTICQSFKMRGTEIKENVNNKSVNCHLYSRCLSMSHYFHSRIIFSKRSSERVTGDRTLGGKTCVLDTSVDILKSWKWPIMILHIISLKRVGLLQFVFQRKLGFAQQSL